MREKGTVIATIPNLMHISVMEELIEGLLALESKAERYMYEAC